MKNYRRFIEEKITASVTVFCILIFTLVLSLVLTMLEGARIQAIKASMSMALSQSMDSVLADYYQPLMEEYHIFARYMGDNTQENIGKDIGGEIVERVLYSTNPTKGLSNINGNLYSPLVTDDFWVVIPGVHILTEYDAQNYYKQVVEAAKIQGLASLADLLLEKTKLIKENQSASIVYEMQSQVQQELLVIDEVVIKLMQQLDGVQFVNGNLQIVNNNRLQCSDVYGKKLVSMPCNMQSVKINHASVFYSLEQSYWNKDSLYDSCILAVDQLIAHKKEANLLTTILENIHKRYDEIIILIEEVIEDYETAYVQLRQLKGQIQKLSKNKKNQKQIDLLETQYNMIATQADNLYDKLEQYYEEESRLTEESIITQGQLEKALESFERIQVQFSEEIHQIEDVLLQIESILSESVELTLEASKAQENAAVSVNNYEVTLRQQKEYLSSEIYESFQNELVELQGYVGTINDNTAINYDFTRMQNTLRNDLKLIQNEISFIGTQAISQDVEVLTRMKESLNKNASIIEQYSIDALEFDYSTINLEQSEQENPVEAMKGQINQGILNLLIDENEEISKCAIDTSQLPSTKEGIAHVPINISNNCNQLSLLDHTVIKDILASFQTLISSKQTIGEALQDFVDFGFFHAYLQSYFKDYCTAEDSDIKTVRLPSVLQYEKEYICFQQETDIDNLSSMIYTLFFIRLVTNMITLFADSKCNNQAKLAATALVAFTGLTVLISVTKVLILTAWAVMEALIDVAILLQGKKLEGMSLKQHHLEFSELLTFNSARIKEKANVYLTKSKLTMDYQQYLLLLMLLQSKKSCCYLSMDMIQSNLNYRYAQKFNLNQCIYGYQVILKYKINPLYALGVRDFGTGLFAEKESSIEY